MNQNIVIRISRKEHRGQLCYFLYFAKNTDVQEKLRGIAGMRYSGSNRAWYVPAGADVFENIKNSLAGLAIIEEEDVAGVKMEGFETNRATEAFELPSPIEKRLIPHAPVYPNAVLSEAAIEKLERFKKWMKARRYGDSTVKTYSDALKTFLCFCNDKSPEEISNEDIIEFNNRYILDQGLSLSFQNQVVNAIKLFYRVVELKHIDPALIYRPKREKKLPNVLSKEEVKAILGSLNNIKHKTMLSLVYSCGLRCGEVLCLKPGDIDSQRRLILIKQAKGKKDRIVPLSDKILKLLRDYWLIFKPEVYLFEGQKAGEAYDVRSLQQVLKQAVFKAGIQKPVTLHWLRHSYATHLLENGTDLRYIQEILGHKSSKTTEIYTHVSNKMIQQIISPFDYL
jgi:integrase/recombinase XerD